MDKVTLRLRSILPNRHFDLDGHEAQIDPADGADPNEAIVTFEMMIRPKLMTLLYVPTGLPIDADEDTILATGRGRAHVLLTQLAALAARHQAA